MISPELQEGGCYSAPVSLLTFGGTGDLEGPGAATRFILPRVAAAEPSLGMFPMMLQCFQRFQRFRCSNLAAGGVFRSVAKMWPSVSLLCVLVAFTSARSVPYFPPLSDDLVNHINKLNTTWKVSTGLMIWGFFFGRAADGLLVGFSGRALGVSPRR